VKKFRDEAEQGYIKREVTPTFGKESSLQIKAAIKKYYDSDTELQTSGTQFFHLITIPIKVLLSFAKLKEHIKDTAGDFSRPDFGRLKPPLP